MKNSVKLLSLVLVLCMLLCSCAQGGAAIANSIVDGVKENNALNNVISGTGVTNDAGNEQLSASNTNDVIPEKGTYNEGVVLVKYVGEFTENVLSQLDFVSAEPLYKGSSWYTVKLGSSMDTVEAVEYLTALDCFDAVDYDYVMATDAETESYDVSSNPNYESNQKKHHDTHKVKDGWGHMKENDKNPGGSSDVVVAVIDTGVDYNHLDLRNNIWTNSAEIPENGIDDDGNGYVDDVYGWDCVNNDNDPMDDNGHGTHVAGIIAAENNDIGGVGVAFNCKVMVIKAGNSSGYFNNSDIAEAIQYAYMNGASVINMSFGGSNISIAVEEALAEAYTSCVLVAAAGNSAMCTLPGCLEHFGSVPIFPAALSYVIGVMSVNDSGTIVSGFSNFNEPGYYEYQYNVYATGESVYSCWPNNKYATLSGTSMAAPMVSAVAALLRANYSDREVYSSKFIQSQIVNTGTINPYVPQLFMALDFEHTVVDVYNALTKFPTPNVYAMNYYIDDSISICAKNNGNGVIDAGETIHLYCSFFNKGGVASNVNVSIDTMSNNDPSLTDPYFTFVNTNFELSDIGTYSERTSGDKYFEIIVDPACPNDYLVNFNIRLEYKNGMDTEDAETYNGLGYAVFAISNGYHLAGSITEDTVFSADKLYIVGEDVVISEGVTVTFEEGCQIKFYDGRDYYQSPLIINYGILKFEGSEVDMVSISPSDSYSTFACGIKNYGQLYANYVSAINIYPFMMSDNAVASFNHSELRQQVAIANGGSFTHSLLIIHNGDTNPLITDWLFNNSFTASYPEYSISNSYVECVTRMSAIYYQVSMFEKCLIYIAKGVEHSFTYSAAYLDNIVYTAFVNSLCDYDSVLGCEKVENNMFINDINGNLSIAKFEFKDTSNVSNNYFSETYQKYASQVIANYYDSMGNPIVDVYGSLADASVLWPNVVSVDMFNKDGEPITVVGKEEITVRVTFNRPMDTTQNTTLSFGTIEPYADYVIEGEYVSDTVWEGTYTLKAQIENGQNFLKVNNACAADDPTKVVFGEYHLHEFTIDTTAAMSMNLQAIAKENGIELTFAQDDYDTLLGYNIYRADSKDGNYVKLNPAILLPTDSTFLDENAEPGKTYWYTYTVVLTDFTESNPAGKVVATAMDTLAPNMYHTPVNQGYMNNNLVISCTASDNVAISSVTLYYRVVGGAEWKSLTMSKQSDKYSATIFGSDLTLDGIEYYIVATDGRNTINKGSAETPYTVIVKDASSISRIGDVDGDGVVTTKDALMLMQCINGDLILSDDEFKRADLNGDGTLNSSEALRILQYINGKVSTLEM